MMGILRAAMGNFKEVAMWLTGVIVGFVVVLNQHYLVGFGIVAFCGFMTKVALADGVRSNAMLAAHAAKQLAEMQLERKRRQREEMANNTYQGDDV